MKNFSPFILLVFSFFNAVSQQTETRDVGTFSGVKAAEGIDVFLKKGDKEEVKVEVAGTAASNVITEVSGSYLKIHRKDGRYREFQAKVYVTYVELNKLSASSAGSIFSESTLQANSLEISASSAGSVEVPIDAGSAEISSSTAGDVELKGRAKKISAEASTAGEIDAYDLLADEVDAEASTAGSVKVNVKESLDARASTGGSIRYRGNPDRLNSNSRTGGSVRKIN
jgi:hypothetical protein